MKEVCIVIRVFNRIEDLNYCVKIIRDTWVNFEYYIIVVSNGEFNGFFVSEYVRGNVNKLVVLKNNNGHLKGNSQLLIEALPLIPKSCEFTIILEADTWLYGDMLVLNYISQLQIKDAVWASAQWYQAVHSLATDFAIIKTMFLKNNPQIFDYYKFPEYYVANYLRKKGFKPVYIKESMPVNLPSYLKRYPYTSKGRFNVFLKSRMVTHHIEDLYGGMEKKKILFNVAANFNYFPVSNKYNILLIRLKINIVTTLYYLIPHKSWFVGSFKNLR